MKPNFDLENPKIKQAISVYFDQIEKALVVRPHVENAVLPVYWTLRSKKPEQAASGVIVRIKTEYFILSASHVFDDIGSHALLVGAGNGNMLACLSGDRFSSARGPSGTHIDDPIDASVFHIQSGITDQIKEIALTLEDFDISSPDTSKSVYLASGFRVKKSKTVGKRATSKRECFPTIDYDRNEYSQLNIDRNTHIALAYDNQVLSMGKWQASPTPKGLSGGAIIRIDGFTMDQPFKAEPNAKQLLAAITIAQRREKAGMPGVLIGTRIGVHLGLIHKYLPDLMIFE